MDSPVDHLTIVHPAIGFARPFSAFVHQSGAAQSPGEWADCRTAIVLRRRNTLSMTITLDTAITVSSPSLWSRITARVGALHLDRLLVTGANPEPGSALA